MIRMRAHLGGDGGFHALGRYWTACVVVVVSGFAMLLADSPAVAVEKGPDASARNNRQAGAGNYPLWRVLPTRSYAILGEGTVRQTRWGIYAFRQPGKGRNAPVCIEEVGLTFFGMFNTDIECGVPSPPAEWPPFTLTSASIKRPESPVVGETVMGMMLGLDVQRVTLHVNPGRSVKRSTRLLSDEQAAKAHVAPFRYLALGLARDLCLDGVDGFDAKGLRVLSTPRANCPSSGSEHDLRR